MQTSVGDEGISALGTHLPADFSQLMPNLYYCQCVTAAGATVLADNLPAGLTKLDIGTTGASVFSPAVESRFVIKK